MSSLGQVLTRRCRLPATARTLCASALRPVDVLHPALNSSNAELMSNGENGEGRAGRESITCSEPGLVNLTHSLRVEPQLRQSPSLPQSHSPFSVLSSTRAHFALQSTPQPQVPFGSSPLRWRNSPLPPAASAACLQRRSFSKKGKGKNNNEEKNKGGEEDEGVGERALINAPSEDNEGTEGDGEVEEVISVKDLHTFEENTTVHLDKSEIKKLLVEGLPVGIERDFTAELGSPFPTHPFIVRGVLTAFLESLQFASQPRMGLTDAAERPPVENRFLLLGPPGSGKSVLLGLAVAWARANGWLVLYVPKAREWVKGGLYYKHPTGDLWDTPVQAKQVLQDLMEAHGDILNAIPLKDRQPLALGQAPGQERPPDKLHHSLPSDEESLSFSLGDLAKVGMEERDASVSALLRLKEEIKTIRGLPVLIAVDEFNQWFTFSTYFQATGDRSRRQIHSRELRMVNSFRSMEDAGSNVVMAAAFSESIAVGKLAPRLPGVPKGISFNVPRYSLQESAIFLTNLVDMRHEQLGQELVELTEEEIVTAHFLAVGNGVVLKQLSFDI